MNSGLSNYLSVLKRMLYGRIKVELLNFRSREWNSIPADDREKMGLIFRDDGEFWSVTKNKVINDGLDFSL
jgi:hypothetical protein